MDKFKQDYPLGSRTRPLPSIIIFPTLTSMWLRGTLLENHVSSDQCWSNPPYTIVIHVTMMIEWMRCCPICPCFGWSGNKRQRLLIMIALNVPLTADITFPDCWVYMVVLWFGDPAQSYLYTCRQADIMGLALDSGMRWLNLFGMPLYSFWFLIHQPAADHLLHWKLVHVS